jgi:hypothetical protein
MSTKLNIEFGPQANEVLEKISRKKATSKADVIRRALNVYNFLEDKIDNNASIFIREPDGDERELLVT